VADPVAPHNLAVSGLSYTFDDGKPAGEKITEIRVGGAPWSRARTIRQRWSISSQPAATGIRLHERSEPAYGPLDIDALVTYMGATPEPIGVKAEARIAKLREGSPTGNPRKTLFPSG
jgi:5'-nucleotidase